MNPKIVGTHKHPTGQLLNISMAFGVNKHNWQRSAKRINDVVEQIPSVKRIVPDDEAPKVTKDEKRTARLTNHFKDSRYIWANSDFNLPGGFLSRELKVMANAVRYDYLLDASTMDRTMAAIEQILTQEILGGSDFWTTRFFMNPFVESAVEDGTTDSFDSAVRIAEGSPVEQNLSLLTAQQQLQTPVYADRLRLVNGRVFELMKGLTADMKSQLRLTLTEGVARGVGIRDLKGMINKRLSVGMVRAERIARTEINNAYRGAYMDEAKDLNETALKDDDWQIMQVHRSALSPTTRSKHAARHGTIHTIQEQKDWWAKNANSINCLCSTLDVLVNKKTGEVLQHKMIDNMLKQKKQWAKQS